MTAMTYTVNLKKTVLASVIGLFLSQSCFALQEISDEKLSETTGEGIAILPQNFSFQFNGADNREGAGYIHVIPVGPLTTTSQDTNKDNDVNSSDYAVGKADIYLYGLALSQANNSKSSAITSSDWNTRFGKDIVSWGTAENPWIIKVATAKDVPNFSATSPTDSGKGDISYLSIEAPLYNKTLPTTDQLGAGAYNLKLGLWGDFLVRDPSKIEGNSAQFQLGQMYGSTSDASRANRLRLQAILNGFSLNGTNLKLFQTLGGASNTGGMSTSYNNTLGLTGVIRLNTGDSSTLRGTATSTTTKGGETTNLLYPVSGSATPNPNSGCDANLTSFANGRCTTQERVIQRTDTTTTTWKAPILTNVLRLSTREKTNFEQGLTTTPALDSSSTIPIFDDSEGLFLYNVNANLVLGNLYQPVTLGVASDGKNIVLEIARIPNKQDIYSKVYTRYAGDTGDSGVSYSGSTCNIYQCGSETTLGGVTYQGANATHSSITIGSTNYDATNNLLTASSDIGAVGISFGATVDGTGIYNKTVQQVQSQGRRWTTELKNTCDSYTWYGSCSSSSDKRTDAWQAWGTYPTSGTGWYNVDRTTISTPQVVSTNGVAGMPTNAIVQQSAPSNNFGSAAIDGLLIQHMKITTKGL
ncbi:MULTISPECIES: hypothetical protein [Acinetobacter]|uniref:Uncharacterized protein n=1 Tax=Acinetobacter ursingii TaxID=108980 RepID=A0A7T9UL16_9GAMM|nr:MULTISPECIES: hypothetical protein [Acinetobacter]QQT87844.1 hypothetical protein I6I53_09200 [Acinetobacter ursingii]RSO83867.1 hypothetical protein EA748_06030 [Acinetobacter ursingii]